ncbi:FecR domain-containing protein [Pseudanabaena sp. 'Roaring Creek']|uniref:FecR domain-containing protein n=1 Tax=Pseudanabaena sp. 'Roaring Creek' TaxID=1681830 RepID=UPI0006D7C749|nr:FecR domain-containing protein [Pseudanabaena sp. 'Roaring Creek']
MKTSLLVALLAIALIGCEPEPVSTPSTVMSAAPKPIKSEKAIAKIASIEEKPVFVLSSHSNQPDEVNAKRDMELYVDDKIRTHGRGKTQVEFNNGVGFRIGGDAVLQIQPQNRLYLTSGKMITWVKPGLKVPTEITTAFGTAAIRGTTAYVEIPKDINQGAKFFSWEGTVVVKLPNQSKEIVLLTGEEIIVKPNSSTPPVVHRLDLKEWKEISKTGILLRSFKTPIPTQSIIDRLVPGQASLDQP